MVYNMRLNRYPEMMMQSVTTPKKTAMSFKVITFFRSIASVKKDLPQPS